MASADRSSFVQRSRHAGPAKEREAPPLHEGCAAMCKGKAISTPALLRGDRAGGSNTNREWECFRLSQKIPKAAGADTASDAGSADELRAAWRPAAAPPCEASVPTSTRQGVKGGTTMRRCSMAVERQNAPCVRCCRPPRSTRRAPGHPPRDRPPRDDRPPSDRPHPPKPGAWRSDETERTLLVARGRHRVHLSLPRYLQRSVLRDALKAQCGAGAGPAKRSSPHCPVCATGESITRVPLRGIAAGDRP